LPNKKYCLVSILFRPNSVLQPFFKSYVFIGSLPLKIASMEPVDLKKLGRLLNLSISTVSKALRDSYDISKETKERVIALANELNYQPNPHASSLRRHESKTIAAIIPEIANNFFKLAINGIESIAQEKGYHVLTSNVVNKKH